MHYQLPVYSPVSAGALLAAVGSLVRDNGAVRWLEEVILAHFGAADALAVDSGTSALALSLSIAAGESGIRTVAMPAYGCYDLVTAAVAAGVSVVLYDVDPDTLSPSDSSFDRALAAGPAAVVVAHLFGIPVDLPPLAERIRAHGAVVIEDAAQAGGARMHGRPAGAFGDVSILSFGRGKGVTGGGGGAMVALSEQGCRAVAAARGVIGSAHRGLRETTLLLAQWAVGRPDVYRIPASIPFLHLGETVYRSPWPARGAARSSAAAVARTWFLADAEGARRRRHAERLRRHLGSGLEGLKAPAGSDPSYLRLPALAVARTRAAAATPTVRALGVVGAYPIALADLPAMTGRCLNRSDEFPGARRLARELITLPTHGRMREPDLARLERWIDSVVVEQ